MELSFDAFVERMKSVQEQYRMAKSKRDTQSMDAALRPLDETQVFWFVPTSDVWLVHYQTVSRDADVEPRVRTSSLETVEYQNEKRNVHRNIALMRGTRFFSDVMKANIRPRVKEGLYDTRKAYLTMAERKARNQAIANPFFDRDERLPRWILKLRSI